MPTLDTAIRQEIVDLLAPLMKNESERQALLALALGHDSPILLRIDLTGAVEPCVVRVIGALLEHGEVEPGRQALWALLEVVRERVGLDRQARIDRLRSLINPLPIVKPSPTAMNDYIFISYRSVEQDFALKLAGDLLQAGYPVWMDRLHGILPGDEWRQSLEKGVTNATGLLVCLSRNYVTSNWCLRELQRADALKKPIFPVLLGPVPDDVWPMEIQDKQYADFRNWTDEAAYRAALALLIEGIRKRIHLQPGPPVALPQQVGQADPGRDDSEDVAESGLAKAVELEKRSGFDAIEAEELRKDMNIWMRMYRAAANQYRSTTDDAARVRLELQMENSKAEWKRLEKRLKEIGS